MPPATTRNRRLPAAIAAAAALSATGALAIDIDTGNPELSLRWDTTLKHSLAQRLNSPDAALLSNPNADDGNRNFAKGLISNRTDLFTELDAVWQNGYGARVSAAAWNDSVYNTKNNNPGFAGGAFPNQLSVAGNEFTDATRRQHGRNAELLDAFVFSKFSLGEMGATVRAGRHSVLWGESLFFGANAISGGQQPVDVVKLMSVPNTQFKEATPEWQEAETGVPAKDVRALARLMARKKLYLAAGATGGGFGGAGRGATGAQWARCMVMLMAMRGLGKPGINMGNLDAGTPLDFEFYFPGYADGGISGELQWNANAVHNYQKMPHVITVNPVRQLVPKQQLPDAIVNGRASGHLWDGLATEIQFAPFEYPMQGYSKIHMIYKYGGSFFSTLTESKRMEAAYRHESIEFVVNQSIWMEGEAQFADVILPACTQFERYDIGEWCSGGGYLPHCFNPVNHRVIALQHKCIEPLGESKSDYQIFTDILSRLGLGAMFTEGCSELDWCKRVFDSTDVAKRISWAEFCRKGYYVVPAEQEALRAPTQFRWFAEGRPKDICEALPLPSQWPGKFGLGLQTPSGKIEFMPETLRRGDPANPERPVLNRYIPSWEGPRSTERVTRFPLQLVATHSRYSFHTNVDGKDSAINEIEDHRVRIGGHAYWLLRMHSADAAERGIVHHGLVKVYNDRGAVICAADVSEMVARGVVKSFESSAEYMPVEVNGETVDFGGSMNILTSSRPAMKGTSSMAPNACLVQVAPWTGAGAPAVRPPALTSVE